MLIDNIHELFAKEIQELLNMEKQSIPALEGVISKLKSTDLKNTLQDHIKQTKAQADRLEEIAKDNLIESHERKCLGIEGIINEIHETMKINMNPQVNDITLIFAIRHMKYYEIGRYKTALSSSQMLQQEGAVRLLEASLKEEDELNNELFKYSQKNAY